MSKNKPEEVERSSCSRLLAWATKRKGCVIGGRELLRQMQKFGCTECQESSEEEREQSGQSRDE